MKEILTSLIPISVIDLYRLFRQDQFDKNYKDKWLANGRKWSPPYYIKHQTIKDFAKNFKIRTFIETGTFYGDMIYHCRSTFDNLYTTELSSHYFQCAKRKFSSYSNIRVL